VADILLVIFAFDCMVLVSIFLNWNGKNINKEPDDFGKRSRHTNISLVCDLLEKRKPHRKAISIIVLVFRF